ncbi:MAG: tyrosine-type recombinase/integrase [Treponema sp.]|nr:tyrosine-type recombinase/integrase [Treponema sp.]
MKTEFCSETTAIYNEFLAYYKPRTSVSAYQTIKYLSYPLISWFEENEIPLTAVSIQDVMNYRNSLNEPKEGKRLSTGSICNYLKMGRKLFKFLVKFEKVETNPFLDVKYPKMPDVISRNILKEPQMNRLLEILTEFDNAQSESEKLEKYRQHVVSVLLYSTGIRAAEAAALLPQDIDVKRREVVIRNGKGGKDRIAFLTGYAADVLDYYIQYGREVMLARGWRKHGSRLLGNDVATLAKAVNGGLKEICKKVKIPVITCHGFRHSLGTHLLRAGCDIRHIQMILGHEKLNSTQLYTRVDRDDLKNIIDQYHPRQSLKRSRPA